MEIDGGPPPFIGSQNASCGPGDDGQPDDAAFAKNPFEDDDVDTSTSSSNLPLPHDPSRSRSVSPIKGDSEDSKKPSSEAPDDHRMTDVEIQKNASEDVEEDDDEWGDFGEAVSAPAPIQKTKNNGIPSLQMMANNDADDDDDDDWGAFDQARPSTDRASEDPDSAPNSSRSQEERQLAHQQSLEEWGAFEEQPQGAVSEDEWQAEFSSASTATTVIQVVEENLKDLEQMLEDDAFWDDGYSEEDEEGFARGDGQESSPLDIPSLFDAEALEELSDGFDDVEKQKYSKLWLSLRVIEEAISLKFDWKQSEIRKNHLRALKIQPIAVKKETRATAAAIFDTSNLLLPTPIQSSSDASDLKTSTSSPVATVVDSPSVPAVDFDWDTSGLTNPMNRANQSSAIIDVDFLGSNGVATAYTSTLQHDLEQFGLTNGGGGKLTSNGSTILETLMSRANGTSGHYRNPEVLSLDARQLLDRLPDLQYLQSEVLMFPVGTNLPH